MIFDLIKCSSYWRWATSVIKQPESGPGTWFLWGLPSDQSPKMSHLQLIWWLRYNSLSSVLFNWHFGSGNLLSIIYFSVKHLNTMTVNRADAKQWSYVFPHFLWPSPLHNNGMGWAVVLSIKMFYLLWFWQETALNKAFSSTNAVLGLFNLSQTAIKRTKGCKRALIEETKSHIIFN